MPPRLSIHALWVGILSVLAPKTTALNFSNSFNLRLNSGTSVLQTGVKSNG